MCIFSPLSNTVYECCMWRMSKRTEWMWTISEEDIYLRLAKKQHFCFI